jgi:hypothetical protein
MPTSCRAKSFGAPINASEEAGLMPSFLTSGVPE